MASVIIAGVGSYAPPKVLTNADLAKMVDTTDEWITSRSGIRERHIAGDHEACSDLAVQAARHALADAKMEAKDIDLLIIATCSPDMPLPSTACIVQHKLGVPAHATCFDIAAAVRKWYGVVPDASKNRPSIEPMHPSVQCGNSISAIVVPTSQPVSRPPSLLANSSNRGLLLRLNPMTL